jgi:cytochrome c556
MLNANIIMTKISLPALAASIVIAASLATAVSAHAQDDGPKTPLAKEMGGMAHDMRTLHGMVADPTQKDAAVALVKDMITHATNAKGYQPKKTDSIPPADRAQFVADYKTAIDGLIADLQKLQDDISSGDTTDATTLLAKISQDKRDGHKKFNAQ